MTAMTAKTCLWCGTPVHPIYSPRDTPEQRTERIANFLRHQRLCDDCWPSWDIGQCPDGQDHEWVPDGAWLAEEDPPTPGRVETCNRCGVGALFDPTTPTRRTA